MSTKTLSKSEFLSLVEAAARDERDDETLSLVAAARHGDKNALGFCQMWADEMPRAMASAYEEQCAFHANGGVGSCNACER